MIEKPSKGRAVINQSFNTLVIEIPARKNWLMIIFTSLWILGWLAGETSVIRAIFFSDTPIFTNIFFLFWLLGWTFGGGLVIFTILWQVIGKEIILINRSILKIEKSVKGIGRKKQYDIKEIKNIDINPTADVGYTKRSATWGTLFGKIKFDYGMKTIKFASDIDEAEARVIIDILKKNSNFSEKNFA